MSDVSKVEVYQGFGFTTTFSPDDGGFYAEVFDAEGHPRGDTGTEIRGTRFAAECDAYDLIDALVQEGSPATATDLSNPPR